jgi:hypothetical protein
VTARRLALTQLPNWPRFLNLNEAAAYVGVSPNVFLIEMKQQVWPAPKQRGTKAGLATWDRALLDAAADRASGLAPAMPAGSTAPADIEDLIRRRISGQTKTTRPQARRT